MTEKHYSLDEIKKLRAAITPGEWHTAHINETYPNLDNGVCIGSGLRIAADEYVICDTTELREVDRQNFEFIAASPQIIDQLLEDRSELLESIVWLQGDIERLKAELAPLKVGTSDFSYGRTIKGEFVRYTYAELTNELSEWKLRAQAMRDVWFQDLGVALAPIPLAESIKEMDERIEKRLAELKVLEGL